jgi:enamine deaminase RidA (YjgF/YER057c/UK114 family)
MQKTAVERIKFYPPVEDEYGYTQTVRVGHTLHLSGMIGHDAGVMHPDPERQYQLVYQNIAEILASNGACLADVIRETVFYTAEMAGIDPAPFAARLMARSFRPLPGCKLLACSRQAPSSRSKSRRCYLPDVASL